ncbi:MAG: hypothetical protein I8H87_07635 [Comamonadaceae bacterium]|nr:hypothetical protein [Comamonadaceae bacterium]
MAFPVGVAELALKRLVRALRVGHWVIYIWGAAAPRWAAFLPAAQTAKVKMGMASAARGSRQGRGQKMPACKAMKKPPEGGFFDKWLALRLRG